MWGLLTFEQMVEMELAAIDNMAKDKKCGKLPSVSVEAKTDENKKSVSDTKAVCAEEEKKTSASSRGRKSVKKDDKTSKDAVNCAKNTSGDEFPRIISLASGSRANCTLIDDGATRILIDFGLSCRMLGDFLKNYGLLISDIDAVFITHEHSDHVSGLATFFKKYSIPVHMTEPSFLAYYRGKGFEFRDKITVHPIEYKVEIGGFTVSSCEVCHDSAACVSYLVEGNGVSFCTCTDLGYVSERVFEYISRAENVILESNHDVELLETGEYPAELKRRIRSEYGHLSNDQCAETLVKLLKKGVKRVLLAHISPENNDPDIALLSALRAMRNAGVGIEYIDVAPRLEPKKLL